MIQIIIFMLQSNSLPSYQITSELPKSILPNAIAGVQLQSGYNANTLKYSILSFHQSSAIYNR